MKNIFLFLTLLMSFCALSQERGPNPYSDCGIGAAIFPNNGGLAAVSNATWDVGTTAVISATASPETCSGEQAQVAQLTFSSYSDLEREAVQGDGMVLVSMNATLACDASQNDVYQSIILDILSNPEYENLTRIKKSDLFYQGLQNSDLIRSNCDVQI